MWAAAVSMQDLTSYTATTHDAMSMTYAGATVYAAPGLRPAPPCSIRFPDRRQDRFRKWQPERRVLRALCIGAESGI